MKSSRDQKSTDELIAKHRKWSTADYVMYEYYSAKLSRTVQMLGDDFQAEVQHYRSVKERVRNHCKNLCQSDVVHRMRSLRQTDVMRAFLNSNRLTLAASEWSVEFSISYTDCLAMMLGTLEYQAALRTKQTVRNCDTGTPFYPSQSSGHYCDRDTNEYLFYTFTAANIQRMVFKDTATCSKYFS